MSTNQAQVLTSIRELDLASKPICIHCSFRSFGGLDGGADALINEFLDLECTVMALCLSFMFGSPPPQDRRPQRNGVDYRAFDGKLVNRGPVYASWMDDVNEEMVGAVSKTLLSRDGRLRGNHPRSSFAAIGPLARELIECQSCLDVFGPLRRLADLGGEVVLMGVGLDKMTLLHLAEQAAGREPFRRWANGPSGAIEVQEGGCSSGFSNFDSVLAPLERRRTVGSSTWRCFNASQALDISADAIRAHPRLTRCSKQRCIECEDAIAGGPIGL